MRSPKLSPRSTSKEIELSGQVIHLQETLRDLALNPSDATRSAALTLLRIACHQCKGHRGRQTPCGYGDREWVDCPACNGTGHSYQKGKKP